MKLSEKLASITEAALKAKAEEEAKARKIREEEERKKLQEVELKIAQWYSDTVYKMTAAMLEVAKTGGRELIWSIHGLPTDLMTPSIIVKELETRFNDENLNFDYRVNYHPAETLDVGDYRDAYYSSCIIINW